MSSTSKFKVGDMVRVVKPKYPATDHLGEKNPYVGEIGIIEYMDFSKFPLNVGFSMEETMAFNELELELVKTNGEDDELYV